MLAALRYRFCNVEGLSTTSIPKHKSSGRSKDYHQVLEPDTLAKIKSVIETNTEFYLIYLLLITLAARIQDLAALRWDSIKFGQGKNDGEIHFVGQKSKSRTLNLNFDIGELLKKWRKETKDQHRYKDLVFGVEGKRPADNLRKKFRYFLIKQGINVKSHDFRKTMLTLLFEDNKDIMAVRDFAGHRHAHTTEGYIGVKKERVRQTSRAMQKKIMKMGK